MGPWKKTLMSDDNEWISSVAVFLGSYWTKIRDIDTGTIEESWYRTLEISQFMGQTERKLVLESFMKTAAKIFKTIPGGRICTLCVTFDRTSIRIKVT